MFTRQKTPCPEKPADGVSPAGSGRGNSAVRARMLPEPAGEAEPSAPAPGTHWTRGRRALPPPGDDARTGGSGPRLSAAAVPVSQAPGTRVHTQEVPSEH